jgi:hypothetical protein
MADNLVNDLRQGCVMGNIGGLEYVKKSETNEKMRMAATRIWLLEASLRTIADGSVKYMSEVSSVEEYAKRSLELMAPKIIKLGDE